MNDGLVKSHSVRSLYALECPEPQEGKWPENPNPTKIDQRRIYPGEGEVFEDYLKSA
jgi:hypothetical protein